MRRAGRVAHHRGAHAILLEPSRLWVERIGDAARRLALAGQRELARRRDRAGAAVVHGHRAHGVVAELDALDLGVVLGREDRHRVRRRQRGERAPARGAYLDVAHGLAELDRLEQPRRGGVDHVDARGRGRVDDDRPRGAGAGRGRLETRAQRLAGPGAAHLQAGRQRDHEAVTVERSASSASLGSEKGPAIEGAGKRRQPRGRRRSGACRTQRPSWRRLAAPARRPAHRGRGSDRRRGPGRREPVGRQVTERAAGADEPQDRADRDERAPVEESQLASLGASGIDGAVAGRLGASAGSPHSGQRATPAAMRSRQTGQVASPAPVDRRGGGSVHGTGTGLASAAWRASRASSGAGAGLGYRSAAQWSTAHLRLFRAP